MKNLFLAGMLAFFAIGSAQEKMMTKTGKINFEASVPTFEEVKAKNENATCVLNPKTGEIATLALMKGFRFKVALMEEHFNENYIESGKYPKATFKGKVQNFDIKTLTATAQDYTIKGKLEIHGKTKEVTAPAKIRKTDSGIEIICNFNVNTDDYEIDIPSVVKSKVSKNVKVACEFLVK